MKRGSVGSRTEVEERRAVRDALGGDETIRDPLREER